MENVLTWYKIQYIVEVNERTQATCGLQADGRGVVLLDICCRLRSDTRCCHTCFWFYEPVICFDLFFSEAVRECDAYDIVSRREEYSITEDEVKKVVKYLKEAHKEDIREMIELSATNITGDKVMFGDDMDNDNDGDALYEDARECVIEAGKASTSYIQRKLKVGYARAARLMDMLEERGIIGPPDGAKPRAVLDRPIKNAASDEIHADMVAAAKSMEESETELY